MVYPGCVPGQGSPPCAHYPAQGAPAVPPAHGPTGVQLLGWSRREESCLSKTSLKESGPGPMRVLPCPELSLFLGKNHPGSTDEKERE